MFHGLVSFENLKQNCCVMVGFFLFVFFSFPLTILGE